jgi:hypothetical protein
LYNVATGKNTVVEALDKVGRAFVAAACRTGSALLKRKLLKIPNVGPLVVKVAGPLLDHLKSPQFVNDAYTTVRGVAVAAWEGIRETGRNIFNSIKNTLFG